MTRILQSTGFQNKGSTMSVTRTDPRQTKDNFVSILGFPTTGIYRYYIRCNTKESFIIRKCYEKAIRCHVVVTVLNMTWQIWILAGDHTLICSALPCVFSFHPHSTFMNYSTMLHCNLLQILALSPVIQFCPLPPGYSRTDLGLLWNLRARSSTNLWVRSSINMWARSSIYMWMRSSINLRARSSANMWARSNTNR